ncbi:hypothetical protein N8I77_009644 [Diaporthe amygdali]|uniref:Uncharacterized protein n=1 Tax=Phomopsis amygdali TaxID=1214568 RepID=A0AAD9SBH6_PHOAM|nr:hypothetical protein N8I77_009644 [Diaporthe amygdali]
MEPWPSSAVRFLGSSIQPHDSQVYAGARHLEITLEGPVLDLKIYKYKSDLVGRSGNAFLCIKPDFEVHPQDLTKYRAVPDGSSCLLLIIVRDEPTISEYINGVVLLKNGNTESGVAKFERIGYFSDYEFSPSSYVDESNEFAEYCGGRFPPFSGACTGGRATWLMERAETRQVTLI